MPHRCLPCAQSVLIIREHGSQMRAGSMCFQGELNRYEIGNCPLYTASRNICVLPDKHCCPASSGALLLLLLLSGSSQPLSSGLCPGPWVRVNLATGSLWPEVFLYLDGSGFGVFLGWRVEWDLLEQCFLCCFFYLLVPDASSRWSK